MCFPVKYITSVILPETNKHLQVPVTMQEFFVFLGCLFFMACHQGVEVVIHGGRRSRSHQMRVPPLG
jgi:hypothetical protein